MELFLQIADLFRLIVKSSIWIETTVWIILGLLFVYLISLSWKLITEKGSPKWSRVVGLIFFIIGIFELLFVLATSFSR